MAEDISETFQVRIAKEELIFSAAHFITYDGDTCERLHGHNYRVAAEVHGALDENQYVVDFIRLKNTLKAIVGKLDHHMLLPTDHPLIQVAENGSEVTVNFEDRRWLFPRQDCVLLPVANTTAELLAQWIGRRLLATLQTDFGVSPVEVRVEVDECDGQCGIWSGRTG